MAAWLSGGWGQRYGATIDSSVVDTAPLVWFPTPLICVNGLAGKGADDVSDIFEIGDDTHISELAVTANDGTTLLKVEVEDWDDISEDFVLWVGKDGHEIDNNPGTPEKIFLYWDAARDNSANVGIIGSAEGQAVWDANSAMALHMENATPANQLDSTSNGNDVASVDGVPSQEDPGKIGPATVYDGDDASIIADSGSLDPTTVTLELWVNFDDLTDLPGGYAIIYDSRVGSAGGDGFAVMFYEQEEDIRISCSTGFAALMDSTTTPLIDTWYYIAVTIDKGGDASQLFVQTAGGVFNVREDTEEAADYVPSTGNRVIGRTAYDAIRYLYGTTDEVRLSSKIREDEWIKANFYAQGDDFLTWGSKETEPAVTFIPQVIMF